MPFSREVSDHQSFKAVLFDLDGTLLDSAVHFHTILNVLAEQEGLPALTINDVRQWASNGVAVMLDKCLNIGAEHPEASRLSEQFLNLYDQQVHVSLPLFDDIAELLQVLAERQLPVAIITNKGRRFYQHIEQQITPLCPIMMGITKDDVTHIKPHPEGLNRVVQALSLTASDCLYVGDHVRDIEAAQRASMASATAEWGYIEPNSDPQNWGANIRLRAPLDLVPLIAPRSVTHCRS